MSPRLPTNSPNPVRSVSAPYPRRPSGQPKSSRQQFSACGACRMRRVRCDLKDIALPVQGPHPACSNCKERGLKCVDEFADVKAVKLLRRGRRLQQVEAIYGKAADQNVPSCLPTRLPSTIPPLQPEFFDSPFWHWFTLQRPLLDPAEFPARFRAHVKGSHPLGNDASLLAMLLVVWAASFGVDERGFAVDSMDVSMGSTIGNMNPATASRLGTRKGNNPGGNTTGIDTNNHSGRSTHESNLKNTQRGSPMGDATNSRRARKERTDTMLREVLELVDIHAIMRRPTLDGVRVLLLLLPLLEDVHPLDRLTMHEASLSQAHSLCTFLSGPPSSLSEEEAVIRARIFWYGHLQEGITTGMRGGRFVLSEDDLDNFQSTLAPFHVNISGVSYTTASGLPSPTSPTFSSSSLPTFLQRTSISSTLNPYLQMTHLFSIPLHLGSVCRRVHTVLTGTRAARRAEEGGGVDGEGMREIWEGLERCWEEFEAVRRDASTGSVIGGEADLQVERFVGAWQIFIFECHNVIRESLKQYSSRPTSPIGHSPPHSPRQYLSPHHLYEIATRKCFRLLPCILSIIKHHLTEYDAVDPAGLFKWDAGLVRDGCFFAAFLSASVDSDQLVDYATCDTPMMSTGRTQFKQEASDQSGMGLGGVGVDIVRPGLLPILDADEGTRICLAAISEMRWMLAKSEEREESIRSIWENNKMKRQHQRQQSHFAAPIGGSQHNILNLPELEYPQHNTYERPPVLPPLSLASPPHTMSMSAPTTACSTDGAGANGWPSYTPPGTATSTTSTGTAISSRGSPVFANMAAVTGAYKGDSTDAIYPIVDASNLDPLAFSSPVSVVNDPNSVTVVYHPQQRIASNHPIHGASAGGGTHGGSGYLDFNAAGGASSIMVHPEDGCAQFADECNGFYH